MGIVCSTETVAYTTIKYSALLHASNALFCCNPKIPGEPRNVLSFLPSKTSFTGYIFPQSQSPLVCAYGRPPISPNIPKRSGGNAHAWLSSLLRITGFCESDESRCSSNVFLLLHSLNKKKVRSLRTTPTAPLLCPFQSENVKQILMSPKPKRRWICVSAVLPNEKYPSASPLFILPPSNYIAVPDAHAGVQRRLRDSELGPQNLPDPAILTRFHYASLLFSKPDTEFPHVCFCLFHQKRC